MGFLHSNMVDSPMGIALLGSNRNRVGSSGRGRCSCSSLMCTSAWNGASIGIMSLFSRVEAPTISKQWVLGSLGPLHILTSNSRGFKIVGVMNLLTLWCRESLTNRLRPLLRLQLSRMEHISS
jgi:hypothetical protein